MTNEEIVKEWALRGVTIGRCDRCQNTDAIGRLDFCLPCYAREVEAAEALERNWRTEHHWLCSHWLKPRSECKLCDRLWATAAEGLTSYSHWGLFPR